MYRGAFITQNGTDSATWKRRKGKKAEKDALWISPKEPWKMSLPVRVKHL